MISQGVAFGPTLLKCNSRKTMKNSIRQPDGTHKLS